MPWNEITETHVAPTKGTSHAAPEAYPYPTPHDGISLKIIIPFTVPARF
jgi:hypothetical protein